MSTSCSLYIVLRIMKSYLAINVLKTIQYTLYLYKKLSPTECANKLTFIATLGDKYTISQYTDYVISPANI